MLQAVTVIGKYSGIEKFINLSLEFHNLPIWMKLSKTPVVPDFSFSWPLLMCKAELSFFYQHHSLCISNPIFIWTCNNLIFALSECTVNGAKQKETGTSCSLFSYQKLDCTDNFSQYFLESYLCNCDQIYENKVKVHRGKCIFTNV